MNLSLPDNDLLGLAWAQFWQVTVLIVAVGFATHLVCRRRPHLAYVLWLLVILKCVTPPLWSSPAGVFSWASGVRRAAEALPVAPVGWVANPSYPEPGLSPTATLPDSAVGRVGNPSYTGTWVVAHCDAAGLGCRTDIKSVLPGTCALVRYGSAGRLGVGSCTGGRSDALGLAPLPPHSEEDASARAPAIESLVRELAGQVGLRRKVRLRCHVQPDRAGHVRPLAADYRDPGQFRRRKRSRPAPADPRP